MAAPQSTDADIKKWLEIVTEGEKSSLNAKLFCAEKKINPKTYSAWKKRLTGLGHTFSKPGAQAKRSTKATNNKRPTKPSAPGRAPVPKVAPNFGTVDPKVDMESLTITATLPNGVMLDLKCPSKDTLDTALKTLLQTLMAL